MDTFCWEVLLQQRVTKCIRQQGQTAGDHYNGWNYDVKAYVVKNCHPIYVACWICYVCGSGPEIMTMTMNFKRTENCVGGRGLIKQSMDFTFHFQSRLIGHRNVLIPLLHPSGQRGAVFPCKNNNRQLNWCFYLPIERIVKIPNAGVIWFKVLAITNLENYKTRSKTNQYRMFKLKICCTIIHLTNSFSVNLYLRIFLGKCVFR